jgi:hypothetical protein
MGRICSAGWTFCLCAAALAPTFAVTPLALAQASRARRVSDSRLGISAEVPPGWTIARRTGFAETVFLLLSPDGSRISLSVEKTDLRSTGDLVEQNRRGLSRQGFVVGRATSGPGDWRSIDLDVPSRGEKLRQLYQVRSISTERQALVLTLVSSASTFAFHGDALAFVIERMTMEDPTPVSTSPSARNIDATRPSARPSAGARAEPRPRDAATAPP